MALDETRRTLALTVPLPRGAPRRVEIAGGGRGRAAVRILGGPAPSAATRSAVGAAVAHVLHLDQDLSAFYATAGGDEVMTWVTAGAGRMLRSPTVWEDVVKTVCTTNCTWALTRVMVTALVTHLGTPAAGHRGDPAANAFPTPVAMAARDESLLPGGRPCRLPRASLRRAGDARGRGAGRPGVAGRRVPRGPPGRGGRATAPRPPGRGTLRRGPHHDDPRPQLPADPGLLDATDVRAAHRQAPAAGRRRDRPPVPRATGPRRGSRSGCSSPATGST